MCYAPQGNITKTKINLQPERFRWTLCTKHKHRCFLESLPESRHPRLKKKKNSLIIIDKIQIKNFLYAFINQIQYT